MSKLALGVGLFFAAAALASGGGAPGEKTDVAEFIFHHVSDSHEYEFEVPLNQGHNPTLHLPFWGLEIAGSCNPNLSGGANLAQGCLDISPTKHTLMLWFSALLVVVLFLVGAHTNRGQLVPKGTLANLLEMMVLFIRDEIAVKNIGKQWGPRYTPYLLSAFFFILTCNLVGLFPWMAAATGNLAVTCGLALCTFFITQVASIRAAGIKTYLAHLTGGVPVWLWPIMVPVEVLGLFTKPFALTVRLFANMLAGHIVIFFLLGLIFIFGNPAVSVISVPFAFGIYLLELFVALVQAYVFTMLSSLFIGMGVAMAHHHDDAHGHEGHGDHGHGAGEPGQPHAPAVAH